MKCICSYLHAFMWECVWLSTMSAGMLDPLNFKILSGCMILGHVESCHGITKPVHVISDQSTKMRCGKGRKLFNTTDVCSCVHGCLGVIKLVTSVNVHEWMNGCIRRNDELGRAFLLHNYVSVCHVKGPHAPGGRRVSSAGSIWICVV